MIFIDTNRFGLFKIGNQEYRADIKIIGDKVKIWNYTEHHKILPDDVKDLVESSPEIIILGTGFEGSCKVQPETIKYLEENNIKFLIKPTPTACTDFNRLMNSKRKVFAILHATC